MQDENILVPSGVELETLVHLPERILADQEMTEDYMDALLLCVRYSVCPSFRCGLIGIPPMTFWNCLESSKIKSCVTTSILSEPVA